MSSSAQECSGMENYQGNGAAKLSKSERKIKRKLLKRKLHASSESFDKREDVENPKSKTEIAKGEKGSSITTADGAKSRSKKQEYMETASDMRGSSRNTTLDATGSHGAKSKVSKRKKHLKIINDEAVSSEHAIIDANTRSASDETVSGKLATSDAKTALKGEEHTVVADGVLGSITTTNVSMADIVEYKKKKSRGKKPTSDEILNPPHLKDMITAIDETCSGTTATDNTASKNRKRERSKKKNSASGDILNTCESMQDVVIAKEGSSTAKIPESRSVEMVSGKTETPDAKMVPKGEELTKPINGKTGSSATTILNVNGTVKEKKKLKSKKKRPTIGEIMNPQCTQDKETANGETVSVAIVIDDAASKKKTQKGVGLKNKKPASADNLSAGESTHDRVTDDASSKQRKKERDGRSKSKKPASGDILSNGTASMKKDLDTNNILDEKPASADNLSAGESSHDRVTDDASSKKRNKERDGRSKSKKPSSGDILSYHMTSMKKDLDTKDILDPKCTSSKREDYMEIINAENCSRTTARDADITMFQSMGSTEVANPEYKAKGASSQKISRERKKNRAMGNACENIEVMAINEIPHVATSRKKLLIFDVNGLIADVVFNKPKRFKPDINIKGRAIYARPFLDNFLRFCFEKFDVAIWSSRSKKVLNPVVHYLLRGLRDKLVFIWDASKCTKTETRTLDNKSKCIVFKDLRMIWNNEFGGSWVKGTYDESNTLLVDDSPYKALLNPKHTGVFPVSYSYLDRKDVSLGPNGDLRTYLEGLAVTDDMKTYVEQHPFGQGAIDETDPNWAFYSEVIRSLERENSSNIHTYFT